MHPILIVDDDPAIAESTKILLEISGFPAVATTKNIEVAQIAQLTPSMVLLDIWMPDADGRDICKALKRDGRTKKIPVILISATQELASSAHSVGADGFIPKPFEVDTLLDAVRKHASDSQ